jgi:Lrp/AsnC family transcriptional regulator for asnA, asnC and gidA
MSRVETDDLDERIIALLTAQGRMSNRAIARELSISEGAVRKRLKRLLDSGACSYGLLVDIEATGMQAFGWLYLKIRPDAAAETLTFVANLDVCSLCARTTGEFNIAAYIYGADLQDVSRTLHKVTQRDGVLSTKFRPAVWHPAHRHEFVALSDVGRSGFWHIGDPSED